MTRDERECGVTAEPMKPVLRVRKIRFTAVHDPVNEGGVGGMLILNQHMGRIEMIMPQERGGPDKWSL